MTKMINWLSWLDFGFMRNALIAILIITPLFGLMGTMIVNKKMAYFSDALGRSVRSCGYESFDGHFCNCFCAAVKPDW